MGIETFSWEVEISGDTVQRLDKALVRELPAESGCSRSRLAGLIRAGCVQRDGEPITEPSARTHPGDVWTINYQAMNSDDMEAEDIPLDILYEDEEVLVIDKPAGLVCHPGRGNWNGTLVNALLHHCGDEIRKLGHMGQPGIVHRLDKNTTGVMVTAKTGRAMLKLTEQFYNRSVIRRYHAIVRGVLSEGSTIRRVEGVSFEPEGWIRIEGAIDRSQKNRIRMTVVKSGGRSAATKVRSIRPVANGAASLVECWLETGRTHQIRVHMELLGHPVIGDPVYGVAMRILPESAGDIAREAAAKFPRQALHAVSLGFLHPTKDEVMQFTSEYPQDMQELLDSLSETEKSVGTE